LVGWARNMFDGRPLWFNRDPTTARGAIRLRAAAW
jgi:hypothetical protein